MFNKLQATKHPMRRLMCVYLAFVIIRFILAALSSAYPLINIDEFLYYGMARSIAEGKGLLFRGQPANYSYILYSLFLSPIYSLGVEGPLLYRLLQLWNIIAITSSVFPIYFLAKDLVCDDHKALTATFISMLLPDFMIGQLMMCENLILPLFFTLFYVFYKYLKYKKTKDIVILGIIGGMLFSIKPGSAIPVFVLFFVLLFQGVLCRRLKDSLYALIGVVITFIVSAFFFGIVWLLGGSPSILSIYKNQVADTSHLDVFFRFIGVYLLYFMLAGGIACFAVICNNLKKYTSEQYNMFLVLAISILITIIGVSWSVNRYEYAANTAHLRYIGMYLPMFYLTAIIPVPDERDASKKRKWILLAVFSVIAIMLIAIGIYSGVTPGSVFVCNMTFAVLIPLFNSQVSSLVVTVSFLLILATLAFVIIKIKKKRLLLKIVSGTLIVLMLVNNIATYCSCYQATLFDFAKQAEEIRTYLSDNDGVLYLYTNERISSYYGAFDVYSRYDISYTSFNDMFNQLYATHGIYKPFIPNGQRGNRPMFYTPDTDTLVMDVTAFVLLKPSDNTKHYTLNDNALHVLKILDKSKPWLDYVAAVTGNAKLNEGDTGVLLIFSEKYFQASQILKMKIKSENETELTFSSSKEKKKIQLMPGTHEYDIQFDQPTDAYNFVVEGGDIRFYKFILEPVDS